MLYQRLLTSDLEERMPPPSSHKQLSPEQIQLVRNWIEQGAQYDTHWAFQRLAKAEATWSEGVQGKTLSETVDHWIDMQIERAGLTASPPADRVTLLRRLWLDVIGLPPSPDDVASFMNDTQPDAVAREVDRLLASPHFGERMAIWWLDLVRYADSVGYHGDQEISVWPYRDYVIRSFNENIPFDQFTIEQLAGDLLPQATIQSRVASGYNRLGMMSAEGGVQDKEYLAKYIAERVRNVSGTWLGLTMGCCECHDHKFDALTSREFYQMEAFFADINERGLYAGANADGSWGPKMQVPSREQAEQLRLLQENRKAIHARLVSRSPKREAAQREWETQVAAWQPITPIALSSVSGAALDLHQDGTIRASGPSPDTDTYELLVSQLPENVRAFKLQVLTENPFSRKGPGRSENGNFVLTEFELDIVPLEVTNPPISGPVVPICQLDLVESYASFEQTAQAEGNPYGKWSVAAAIDRDSKGVKWGWAILEQSGRQHEAVFRLASPLTLQTNQALRIRLHQNHDNPQHTLGRFRLLTTSASLRAQELISTPKLDRILKKDGVQRTKEQEDSLAEHFQAVAAQLQPLRDELSATEKAIVDLTTQIPTTLITQAVEPREVRVLPRGNWMDATGEVVSPAFPAAIHVPSFTASADRRLTRLDLARWLTNAEHPLTARVLTNRLWKLFFGVGLSRKLDDFGTQGEPPTHPELLDLLAVQMIESRWNIKQFLRSILLTRAYQRTSLANAEQLQLDASNRLLARQSRFRLDAELVRDNALAVSGLLNRQIGGHSVKPYQPPGYWDYLNFPAREWKNDSNEKLYRRGLYTHWQRQYLHPSLMAFDAPSREECTADRPRSNTPLQSLALLNDPTYAEAARVLADRVLGLQLESDLERITWLTAQVLSRRPLPEELQVLSELLEQARQDYHTSENAAQELLTVGQTASSYQSPQELAAWSTVTRVMLNLHEFMTRN